MKNYFIFDYISNISIIDSKETELALQKLPIIFKKFSYSIDVKTYEDAIKNLDMINVDAIQKHNTFLKITKEQEDSLRLLQEII